MKIHINHFGALSLLRYAFKHLLNLTDKSLLSLRTAMVKTDVARDSKNLGMRNPSIIYFLIDCGSKNEFCFKTRFGQKKLFITVFTIIH